MHFSGIVVGIVNAETERNFSRQKKEEGRKEWRKRLTEKLARKNRENFDGFSRLFSLFWRQKYVFRGVRCRCRYHFQDWMGRKPTFAFSVHANGFHEKC
jgi:hypothetical protein